MKNYLKIKFFAIFMVAIGATATAQKPAKIQFYSPVESGVMATIQQLGAKAETQLTPTMNLGQFESIGGFGKCWVEIHAPIAVGLMVQTIEAAGVNTITFPFGKNNAQKDYRYSFYAVEGEKISFMPYSIKD